MDQPGERYKRAADRKKTAPVKRVAVSTEAARAYEKLVKERDDRDRDYGRHLSQDKAPK